MDIKELNIPGVFEIIHKPFEDERGFFYRLFCSEEFKSKNINFTINQANHSFTKQKGSFRGLHYQFGKFAEWKMVRCVKGKIIDIGLDLRKDSTTFLQHIQIELSEQNNCSLLLPPGVAHGFQTLSSDVHLIYLHSSFYNKDFEGGVRYDDEKIKLSLPLPITNISEKDLSYPFLTNQFKGIEYEL